MSKSRVEIPVMEPLENFETWLIGQPQTWAPCVKVMTLAFGCVLFVGERRR